MLESGRWQATAEGDGQTQGYHLSSLYSPVEHLGFSVLGDKAFARLTTILNILGLIFRPPMTSRSALRLSRTKNLHFAKATFPGFSACVDKSEGKWIELDANSDRIVNQDYGAKLDAEL
jgi:hypothetical protein